MTRRVTASRIAAGGSSRQLRWIISGPLQPDHVASAANKNVR